MLTSAGPPPPPPSFRRLLTSASPLPPAFPLGGPRPPPIRPAVKKNKKHNPLLEWDDSISNPSSTPPSKLLHGRAREPHTAALPSTDTGLDGGREGLPAGRGQLTYGVVEGGREADEELEEDDWPPPAPGTFGYKPPRSRTTTTTAVAASAPPPPPPPPPPSADDPLRPRPLEQRPDPADAGPGGGENRWDPLGRPAPTAETGSRSPDMHSPAPSSSVFDGSANGHRSVPSSRALHICPPPSPSWP